MAGASNLTFRSCVILVAAFIGSSIVECQKIVPCDDKHKAWLHCKDDPDRCVSDDALCDGTRDCEGKHLPTKIRTRPDTRPIPVMP